MAPREGQVEVPGARLFYLDAGGSGSALVLLHAGTGSARVWEHQWAPLGTAGYRVIAYDRRGYGRTTDDPDGPPGTAADDLKALTDALALDRFHLVGTAAGGIVAIDFALAFPDRLRSLVVANSLGGVTDPRTSRSASGCVPRNSPRCRPICASSVPHTGPPIRRAPIAGWRWSA